MKKIPTLFKRVFSEDHKTKTITSEITPGCEVVLKGECVPTIKYDGAACAVINGEIYKRYDAKQKYGKKPPEGAIPCQPEPDPVTGHWPHWVKCEKDNPADKYFLEAYANTLVVRNFQRKYVVEKLDDGTYEACGPAWQSNPHGYKWNCLVRHGEDKLSESDILQCLKGATPEEAMALLRFFFRLHVMEGIVFWHNGEPLCKIKRSDFGLPWPIKKGTA